jgi:hypothetical protein
LSANQFETGLKQPTGSQFFVTILTEKISMTGKKELRRLPKVLYANNLKNRGKT